MKTEYTKPTQKEETEMTIIACGDEYTDETKEALDEAAKGYNSKITQEVWGEVFERDMPQVREEVGRLEREGSEKIEEIKEDFREIIEKNFEVKFEPPREHEKEAWKLDDFEKEGFGPIARPLPEPKGLFGDIKSEKIDEVEDEVRIKEGKIVIERTLGTRDPETGTITGYEPRKEEEIKEKVFQLQEALRTDFEDKATPEEKAIIKELEIAKDAEKIQREWIKEGARIHEKGHHILDRIFTPTKEAKLEKYYQECKERDKFISHRAQKDRHEFYCENLRVFCTQEGDKKVKECHPGMYRLIENDVKFLESWEMVEEYYKEK